MASFEPMNAEVKEEWLAKLRDPETKQGTGRLCRIENGTKHYCCLGVLSAIAVQHGVISRIPNPDPGRSNAGHYLSDKVASWAGLPRANGLATVQSKLASMNDLTKKSLTEIADWIDRNL